MSASVRRAALATTISVSLAGCASLSPPCQTGQSPAVQEWLYFGTGKPAGHVAPEEWAQFLADAVTPRFPDGLTVWQASGQWRGPSGAIVREPSYVLSLVHAPDAAAEDAVRELVDLYKRRFQQEAVLRVRAEACGSL